MTTWTLVPSIVERSKSYIKWKLHCICDGALLAATDVLSETWMERDMKSTIQGLTLMSLKIKPGAGSVIPDNTINLTLSDTEGDPLLTIVGASKDAASWHDCATDLGQYPTIFSKFHVTFNDIGTALDEVDLYFICWKENA